MRLEDSLGRNNEYAGLYGEVVTRDTYLMRDVDDIVSVNDPKYIHEKGHKRAFDFIPDTILDLGANVGIFSRYARVLFPSANIIAVEPNPENCEIFREYCPDITLIEKAIGNGYTYHKKGSNGAMNVYLSETVGFTKESLQSMDKADEGVMLTDLPINGKVLAKIDIEGAETVIFNDPESLALLKTFDYICMELHYYASDGNTLMKVFSLTNKVLEELKQTHITKIDHPHFYATKK